MKSSNLLSASLLALCVGPAALGATVTVNGKIYEPQLSPAAPLFTYENVRHDEAGLLRSLTHYLDATGKLAVDEEVRYEGGQFRRYEYRQLQTNEHGTIEVRGDRVYYSFTNAKGTDSDDQKWEADMILPDMLGDHLKRNWDRFQSDEKVRVKFLVLEKQDYFSFYISREKELTLNGVPAVEFKMKASSIFVSLAAPAFYFYVEKDGEHRLLQMEGRLPVRVPERVPPVNRGDWRAIDGKLVLDYGAAASSEAPALPAPSSAPGAAAPSTPAAGS